MSDSEVIILRPVLFCIFCARNIVVVLLVVLGSLVEYTIMECSVRLKWISKMDFVINERILDNGMSMPMLEKELNTISEKSMDEPSLCTDLVHDRLYKRTSIQHNRRKIKNVATSTFDCIIFMEEELDEDPNNTYVIKAWCSVFTIKNIALIENICVRDSGQGIFGMFINKLFRYLSMFLIPETRFVLFVDPSNKQLHHVYKNVSCGSMTLKCYQLDEDSAVDDVKFHELGATTQMAYVSHYHANSMVNDGNSQITTPYNVGKSYSKMNRRKMGQVKRRERERSEKDAVEALRKLNTINNDVSDADDSVLGDLTGYGNDNQNQKQHENDEHLNNVDSYIPERHDSNISKRRLGQLKRRERERIEKAQKPTMETTTLVTERKARGRPPKNREHPHSQINVSTTDAITTRKTRTNAKSEMVEPPVLEKRKRGRPPKNREHSHKEHKAKCTRLFKNVSSEGVRFTSLFQPFGKTK